jgi:uncharacterized membrane-anchored protein YitT (DUF2179 family)
VDFLIHGVEEYTAITIMSDRSEEIRETIVRDLGRGVTVYKGRGGLSDTEQDILFSVVTRLEIGRVTAAAKTLDREAFIVIHPLAAADGGVVKRLALHS